MTTCTQSGPIDKNLPVPPPLVKEETRRTPAGQPITALDRNTKEGDQGKYNPNHVEKQDGLHKNQEEMDYLAKVVIGPRPDEYIPGMVTAYQLEHERHMNGEDVPADRLMYLNRRDGYAAALPAYVIADDGASEGQGLEVVELTKDAAVGLFARHFDVYQVKKADVEEMVPPTKAALAKAEKAGEPPPEPTMKVKQRLMEVACAFPLQAMGPVLKDPAWQNLPHLVGISRMCLPYFNSRGEVCRPKQGYCHDTGIYYVNGDNPDEARTFQDVDEAFAFLEKQFQGFTYLDPEGDLARSLLFQGTIYMKDLITQGRTPLFLTEANRPGAGKDTLIKCCAAGVLGYVPPEMTYSKEPETLKSEIYASINSGNAVVHMANAKAHLDNDVLEQLITGDDVTARKFFTQTQKAILNKAVYALSINNATFSEDLARRMVRILLVRNESDEEYRKKRFLTGDNKVAIEETVRQSAPAVRSAWFTIIQNWVDKGMPQGEEEAKSYEDWGFKLGGIFEAAGRRNPLSYVVDATNLASSAEDRQIQILINNLVSEFEDTHAQEMILRDGKYLKISIPKHVVIQYILDGVLFPGKTWGDTLPAQRSSIGRFLVKSVLGKTWAGYTMTSNDKGRVPTYVISRRN